jgi:hypothetical protein
MNDSQNNKFGMDSFSLRANGMHFSLHISAGKFIVIVLFYVCEEQEAIHSCTDSEYFRFFWL